MRLAQANAAGKVTTGRRRRETNCWKIRTDDFEWEVRGPLYNIIDLLYLQKGTVNAFIEYTECWVVYTLQAPINWNVTSCLDEVLILFSLHSLSPFSLSASHHWHSSLFLSELIAVENEISCAALYRFRLRCRIDPHGAISVGYSR